MNGDDGSTTNGVELGTEGSAVGGAAAVPDGVIGNLAASSGWLRLMAVLGFISAGLMGLSGLVIALTGVPNTAVGGRLLGLAYLVLGGVYLLPILPLYRSAVGARRLLLRPDAGTALDVVVQQRIFWRRLGILTLVMLGITALSLLAMMMAWLAK